jgi:hypothetical protein
MKYAAVEIVVMKNTTAVPIPKSIDGIETWGVVMIVNWGTLVVKVQTRYPTTTPTINQLGFFMRALLFDLYLLLINIYHTYIYGFDQIKIIPNNYHINSIDPLLGRGYYHKG